MLLMAGATDKGRRDHNEDTWLADPGRGLALVADGMGGYVGGEIAAALVKETVAARRARGDSLSAAIAEAHRAVKAAVERGDGGKGMGSTVVAAAFEHYDYAIAWVGDSRAYLWDGELKQLTRDHSYVESLLAHGLISHEEAADHPNKNLITQAVGAAGSELLDIDEISGRLARGQYLLLCSDGLTDKLSEQAVAQLLARGGDIETTVNALVKAAYDAGGQDNITALLVSPGEAAPADSRVPAPVRIIGLDGTVQRPQSAQAIPQELPGADALIGSTASMQAESLSPANREDRGAGDTAPTHQRAFDTQGDGRAQSGRGPRMLGGVRQGVQRLLAHRHGQWTLAALVIIVVVLLWSVA